MLVKVTETHRVDYSPRYKGDPAPYRHVYRESEDAPWNLSRATYTESREVAA